MKFVAWSDKVGKPAATSEFPEIVINLISLYTKFNPHADRPVLLTQKNYVHGRG